MTTKSKLFAFTGIAVPMVCLAAWQLRPLLSPQVQTYTEDGDLVRVKTERGIEFLPVNEWGIGESGFRAGSGLEGFITTYTETRHKLMFVSVTDTKHVTHRMPLWKWRKLQRRAELKPNP